MTDSVFISYSSKDTQTVKKITQTLSEAGIRYWKAPEMIPAGSNYAREIPRAIEKCQVFLLILSESSQNSIWVEKEIDCAINHRKTIVPVNLTGAPLSEMFRFYLNNVQTIFYFENEKEATEQLLDRLRGLIGEKQAENAENYSVQPYSKSFSAAAARMELPKGSVSRQSKEETVFSSKYERHNALQVNQVPVICKRCGGGLKQISRGTYQCVDCGFEDYDSYQKVRNFLDKEGPRSVTEIMRATGIPRSTIEYFLRDERLEIPIGSPILLVCSGCGAGIRTGELCDACKNRNVKIAKRKFDDNQYRFFDRNKRQ